MLKNLGHKAVLEKMRRRHQRYATKSLKQKFPHCEDQAFVNAYFAMKTMAEPNDVEFLDDIPALRFWKNFPSRCFTITVTADGFEMGEEPQRRG